MNLILGSNSPRRKELLQGLGFDFKLRVAETDESYPHDLPTEHVAAYIANKKSEKLLNSLNENELLICADTIVSVDNRVLGKPANKSEAIEMLELLSGRSHEVMTGVCLSSLKRQIVFTVKTEVHFHPLNLEMITFYIDNYNPFDKAGAYGIQEWIGYVAVSKIKGSYTNVVGLPTDETYRAIIEFK